MPGKKAKKKYFDEEQERASIMYLTATTISEKNKIYNTYLQHPLEKMTESIIRRYKLYVEGMTYEELFSDTISYLITKMDKYDPHRISDKTGKTTRAYSYFQTIIKNRLLANRVKEHTNMKRYYFYEDAYRAFENNEEYSYEIDDQFDTSVTDMMKNIIRSIEKELAEDDISVNENKIGLAIIDLINNWEMIFESNNNKFNKNIVLKFIREYTLLTTKDIRNNIGRFKALYFLVKDDMIENNEL